MTKLCVISDTHGAAGMLERAAQLIEKGAFAQVIHLGDFRRDAEWLEKRLQRSVMGVAGNCDMFSRDAREIEQRVEGVKVLIAHGDRYGVKQSYDRLSYHAEERRAQLALFGHTHAAFSGYVGSALLVNPGALMDGRFAVVEIDGERMLPRLLKL